MAGKIKKPKKDGLRGFANVFIDEATDRTVVKFIGENVTNEQLIEAAVILLQVANRVIDNKPMVLEVVRKAMGEAVLFDKSKMH